MGRQKEALNAKFKLNRKKVYDQMELLGIKDIKTLSLMIGGTKDTAKIFLNQQRIPKKEVFEKLQEVLQCKESDLLLPLVSDIELKPKAKSDFDFTNRYMGRT